jgi:hypothetical protein
VAVHIVRETCSATFHATADAASGLFQMIQQCISQREVHPAEVLQHPRSIPSIQKAHTTHALRRT